MVVIMSKSETRVDGWVFAHDTDEAVCSHGNRVEIDGTCHEEACVNPMAWLY